VTHAFFKALLFLGAGSVIHGLRNEQDMRKMGGLRAKLPTTFRTMLIATLAIAGIPPLAGFFSKDEILWQAFDGGRQILWAIGFVAAGLTALYMFRLIYLTFYGRPHDRRAYEHAHESPPVMTVPLVILAVLSVVGGTLGIPRALGGPLGRVPNLLETWLEPVFARAAELRPEAAQETARLATEYGLMVASVAVAFLGIGLATYFYRRRPELPARVSARFPAAHRLLQRKYYVDELYGAVFVRPYLGLSAFAWRIVDEVLIDGFVVKAVGGAVAFYSRVVARLQTGLVQNYAAALFVGAVILLGWYLLR
jgi:NADH-quinone oxidoreductase subunit L